MTFFFFHSVKIKGNMIPFLLPDQRFLMCLLLCKVAELDTTGQNIKPLGNLNEHFLLSETVTVF